MLLQLYHVCITPSLKLSSSLLCGSHGTNAVAHQALPFVTATDGASVCVRVRAMFPTGTNTLKRGGRAAQGTGRYKPTLRRDLKSNRAATVTTAAAVQQY